MGDYDSLLTVTVPAVDSSLLTLDVVKDELNVIGTAQDARITRWMSEAQAAFEGMIGRPLRAETVVETFRRNRDDFDWLRFAVTPLYLQRTPVISLVSVTEEGAIMDPATEYEAALDRGAIWRLHPGYFGRTNWRHRLIVVSYSGGYPEITDVPADVQGALLTMLRYRKAAQSHDPMERMRSIPGVLEQQFQISNPTGATTTFTPEVIDVVNRYRSKVPL
jgi:hypothetical protein